MERAGDGPAASEVYMSEEAVVLPLQKFVRDHHQEQLPYIDYVTAILLLILCKSNITHDIIDK